MENGTENENKHTAPYLPFRTFETALDHLAALGGIPAKIDHSVFPSMGGVLKGQVLSAFKFLGLIDAQGKPDPILSELVLNKEDRKATIRRLIGKNYPNISESDLATMSLGHLDAKLADGHYNAQGATRQKVRTFLLKAAVFSGIPLSKLLTQKGSTGPRKKRAATANERGNNRTPPADTPPPPAMIKGGAVFKTIELKKGGTLSLSLDINLLEFDADDRKFVFGLIDSLQAYEKSLQESSKE